jgi:uncharacterized protein (TIGR04222 family)
MSGGPIIANAALVANAALLAAGVLIRFPFRRRTPRELRPTEVALLRSGPAAAVVTALVLLHARAAVDAAAPGTVRRTGALPRGCDPLARLVYESLARPGGPRELATRGPVRGGLTDLATGLAGAGLVLPARRGYALRIVAVGAGLATVAGLLAIAGRLGIGGVGGAGALGGHPALAAVALVALAVASAGLALLPRRTGAGRRLMRRLRRRHADLTPEHGPDAADWSPQVHGLAVALYGADALRLTFPRFASQGGLFAAARPAGHGNRDDRRPPGPRRTRPARRPEPTRAR